MSVEKKMLHARIKDASSPLLRSNAMNLATEMKQKPILVGALIEATSTTTMTKRSEPVTQQWFCTWGQSTLSGSSLSSFKLSIVTISYTLMGFWYRVPHAEIGQFRETAIPCQWSSSASLKHTLREGRSVQHDGIAGNHSGQSANKTERYTAIARK